MNAEVLSAELLAADDNHHTDVQVRIGDELYNVTKCGMGNDGHILLDAEPV